MTDLATAYFERAERAKPDDGIADYQMAADLLSRALAKDPGNAVDLFNRALILEKLQFRTSMEA